MSEQVSKRVMVVNLNAFSCVIRISLMAITTSKSDSVSLVDKKRESVALYRVLFRRFRRRSGQKPAPIPRGVEALSLEELNSKILQLRDLMP